MREEIATFLANDVKDPRVMGLVTVTAVELTRDLRHAKVFVSVLGSEEERDDTARRDEARACGKGHLRHGRLRVGSAHRASVAGRCAAVNDGGASVASGAWAGPRSCSRVRTR